MNVILVVNRSKDYIMGIYRNNSYDDIIQIPRSVNMILEKQIHWKSLNLDVGVIDECQVGLFQNDDKRYVTIQDLNTQRKAMNENNDELRLLYWIFYNVMYELYNMKCSLRTSG